MSPSRARVRRGLRAAATVGVCLLVPTLAAAQEALPPFTGEIASLTLDQGGDSPPGGTIVVSGVRVIIPGSLNIDLPAAPSALAWVFQGAPGRCRERGESGLAKADRCRVETEPEPADARGDLAATVRDGLPAGRSPAPRVITEIPPAVATIEAARMEDGRLVAASVHITRALEQLMGGVTFINPEEGYIRINGHYRQDEGGTMIRLNDPSRLHGDQQGAACGTEANCSPDTRFRVSVAGWTARFERGNPVCIGGNAQGCHAADRKLAEDDVSSRIPILVGDNVTVEGSFQIAGGLRYFSAQTLVVQF